MIAPNFATYVGQVSVTGQAYQQALRLDASPGNDMPEASFSAILRVVAAGQTVEAEFPYTVTNSGYRAVDDD
jgi:hypothetical protein